MARAEFKLPNGTLVTVEGAPEEIQALLQYYGAAPAEAAKHRDRSSPRRVAPAKPQPAEDAEIDRVHEVATKIKASERFDAIESKILDQRSQLNRILLPLFIIHEEMSNAYGLTSGEIAKVTRELGVPIGQPDVSNILGKEASKFVIGDRTRASGKPVRYMLSRRGVQYVDGILTGPKPGSP